MKSRPRIDLDGVALVDPDRAASGALAVFRFRTTEGLVVLMPESGDFTVLWEHISNCAVDLVSGQMSVVFDPAWAEGQNWLRGAKRLAGEWTDRHIMNG